MKTSTHAIALFLAAFAAAPALAAPTIRAGSVTFSQPMTREAVITYDLLDGPAIVTIDIQTNGVSIGDANLHYMAGDVNKIVATGTRTAKWRPDKAWPDHKIASGVTAVVTAWALDTPPDYMVVSLKVAGEARFYTSEAALPEPGGITNDLYKTEYLVMRKIPAANVEWRMGAVNEQGSVSSESGQLGAETPHIVSLPADYYIGVYEVTQRQYELLGFSNPSRFKNARDYYATRPVECVAYTTLRGTTYSWPQGGHSVADGSVLKAIRDFTGMTGFDLPTEAQWEFACRAGCGSALYTGKEITANTGTCPNVGEVGRYLGNGGDQPGHTSTAWVSNPDCTTEYGTAAVGSYKPNAFGLYDMLGNVLEWTLDWYSPSPIGYDWETGPASASDGNNIRTVRGGAWCNGPQFQRCAARSKYYAGQGSSQPCTGFRLACSIDRQ